MSLSVQTERLTCMNGRKMGAKTETLRLESSQSVAIQSDDVIVRAFLVGPSPDPGAANAAPGSAPVNNLCGDCS